MGLLVAIMAFIVIVCVAFCVCAFAVSAYERDFDIMIKSGVMAICGALLLIPIFTTCGTETDKSPKESVQNVEDATSTKVEPRRDTIYIGSTECEKTTYDTEDIDDYYKKVILGE